jgi:hypothetical protein
MLRRKTAVQEAEPPARTHIDLEAEALERLNAAQARIAEVKAKIADFRVKCTLWSDGRKSYPAERSRDELDREWQELVREHDDALYEFHPACAEWAQYKK